MNVINLGLLRKLEIQAEQFNLELFDFLTPKFTGSLLDKKLISLTRIKPIPSPILVQEVFDEAFSTREVGECFRESSDEFDILRYPITQRHRDTIKIEIVFRHYFERILRSKESCLHISCELFAASLARTVMFGNRTIAKQGFEDSFINGYSFVSNIKLLSKALHDDFDIPMYVILKQMNMFYPNRTTLVKNLSVVAHQKDIEAYGSQALYDVPQVLGKSPINQERIEELVTKITTSNTFKHENVAHADTDNGIIVSTSVAKFIHPDDGDIDDCTLYLVSNTSLYIGS